ncbi:uncharacterized protein LOC144143466 [Haemaphysalis longicornis]
MAVRHCDVNAMTEEDDELAELRQRLQTAEKQASQVTRLKDENRALGKQVSQLERELDQVSSQLERSMQETDRQLSAKLRDKNVQMAQLLADLQEADAEKHSLQSQLGELTAKLADAADQMDATADELTRAQEEANALRLEVRGVREENASLLKQVEGLEERLSAVEGEVQAQETSARKEVAALREVIIGKEREIAVHKEQLATMEERLAQLCIDSDHSTVNLLRKALEEREREVSQLSQTLEQATRDLEDQSAIIEALQMQRHLQQQQQQDGGGEGGKQQGAGRGGRWLDLQRTLREKSLLLRSVQEMLARVEEEARAKDKDLADAVATARKYELGEYGLSDAVAEIKDLKRQLHIRDREIEKLTRQLNEIEMEVQEEFDASPRRKRATRSELVQQIERLESENRRQRKRLGRKLSRSPPEVVKRHANAAAQTSPSREECSPRGGGSVFSRLGASPDVHRSDEGAGIDGGLTEDRRRAVGEESRQGSPASLSRREVTENAENDVPEDPVELVKERGDRTKAPVKHISESDALGDAEIPSLVRLHRETVREAKAWKADVLRWAEKKAEAFQNNGQVPGSSAGSEENALLRSQLSRQASLDLVKDDIILEQLGRFEAAQEMAALRVRCLQQRLEASMPKEAYSSLYDAYSKLASVHHSVVEKLARDGILDNAEKVDALESLEKGSLTLAVTDGAKLAALESENERLRREVADRAGALEVLRGSVARLRDQQRRQPTEESPGSRGHRLAESSAHQEIESLKTLLERLWAHFQDQQKRCEAKDGELLNVKLEIQRRAEEQEHALRELKIENNATVPVGKLENLLSHLTERKTRDQATQPDQDVSSCKKCGALTESLRAQAEELITARLNAKQLRKILDEEQLNVRVSATSLRVKDKIIEELRLALLDARKEEAPCDKSKLRRSLRVAMLTVKSLQALLRQKEATVERYRACVASLRDEMQTQCQRMAAEARVLRSELLSKGAAQVAAGGQQQQCDDPGERTQTFQDKLEQLRSLDEAHKEAVRLLLDAVQAAAARKSAPEDTRVEARLPAGHKGSATEERLEDEAAEEEPTRREADKSAEALRKELEAREQSIAQREAHVEALEARLGALQSRLEEAAKKRDLGSLVHRLKAQVDDKERQLRALSQALVELRAEMMRSIELNVVGASSQDDDCKDLAQLRSDLRAAFERERFLEDEARLLREENECLKEKQRQCEDKHGRSIKHQICTRRAAQKAAGMRRHETADEDSPSGN